MQREVARGTSDGGIVIEYKHNKSLVGVGRMLRKNMTREEKHLWYDFLRLYPVRFSRQKVIRIPNTEIHTNLQGVCDYIDRLVKQSLSQLR